MLISSQAVSLVVILPFIKWNVLENEQHGDKLEIIEVKELEEINYLERKVTLDVKVTLKAK